MAGRVLLCGSVVNTLTFVKEYGNRTKKNVQLTFDQENGVRFLRVHAGSQEWLAIEVTALQKADAIVCIQTFIDNNGKEAVSFRHLTDLDASSSIVANDILNYFERSSDELTRF